ncbi:hypothetical protein B0920_17475 [Massilia sp. KIM]|uniref:hypothetical protein n=1 Tax=Massilia sp. KIM TaxID=1955422 RepID=UPI0009900B14|nr:hypothetical protein [Massilia sp. KIM]OON60746.1 hypothetical protein B0920_17475 [Massilia sp. KIM]
MNIAPAAGPRRHAPLIAFLAVLAGVVLFLYQRNHGLMPSVFADEWYYSRMSRLAPHAEALVPSYLYIWLFGASKACGAGFLECVRAGNLLFLAGATPFVYLTARRYASAPWAGALALFSLLSPLNLYSAYFMPETTYYFGFCVLSWVALTRGGWHWAAQGALAGLVVGLMSLVKVHALFLLPGVCLFLAYCAFQRGGRWLLPAAGAMLVTAGAALGAKFGLGYLLVDQAGLSLWGPFYGRAATTATTSMLDQVLPALTSAKGHLIVLALLFALPLAVLGHLLCTRVLRRADDPLGQLALYTLLTLGAAAAVTIMYTASLAMFGVEELMRLHLRYYSFGFPLLWTVAAAAAAADQRAPVLRWILALGLCAVLHQLWTDLPLYRLLMVDGPDIAGIDLAHPGTMALVVLQAALLLGWAAGVRAAPLLFVFVALPASLAAGQSSIGLELAKMRTPAPGDLAGPAVRQHVPAAELPKLTIAGDNPQVLMRAQFAIDHPDTQILQLPPGGAPLTREQLPKDLSWMLMLGPNHLPPELELVTNGPGYRLVRLAAPGGASAVAAAPARSPH